MVKNNMVMLFHTKAAAEEFCDELKKIGINDDAITLIDADDLPQYGRGEHAVGVQERVEGFLDKLGSLFGERDLDPTRSKSLSDILEDKGLDRAEADYYEQEVRSGSTMLCVLAGDHYAEIKDLADRGIVPRGERGSTNVLNEGVLGRRVMPSDAPRVESQNVEKTSVRPDVVIDEETSLITTKPVDRVDDIKLEDISRTDQELFGSDVAQVEQKDYAVGSPGDFESHPFTGQPIGKQPDMVIGRNVDTGFRSDASELGITPVQRREETPGDISAKENIPPGAESRPVRPTDELDKIKRERKDEDEYRERPAA